MDAPRQDWKLYDELTLDARRERLRRLTPQEGFRIFESLRELAASMPMPEDQARRLAARRWDEKLETRRRMVRAFQALDAQGNAQSGPE